MTTRYKIKAIDDILFEKDDLINFLKIIPGEIILTTGGEGFSLHQCGLIDILTDLAMLDRVSVDTPNYVEQLPIKYHTEPDKISHWFHSCRKKINTIPIRLANDKHYRTACFIGRRSVDRLSILYWLSTRHDALISLMNSHWHYSKTNCIDQWVNNIISFDNWIKNNPLKSLDNSSVEGQYTQGNFLNTQLNLLQYYDQFDVELVCETFVRGDTFFPTEKTVRPIIGKKPMVVYGPRNYLKHLRDLGFKTWDSVWDESYDQYEGAERWKHMKPVIDQINFWGEWEWAPTGKNGDRRLQQANEIAEYNYNHFLTITTRQ